MDSALILFYIVLIFLILVSLNWEELKAWISGRFFGKKKSKGNYICPQCGSTSWKFPNPIKPSPSMINVPSLVNVIFECRRCGYIGIFFRSDKPGKFKKSKARKFSK